MSHEDAVIGDERGRPPVPELFVIDGTVRLAHLDEDVTGEVEVTPHASLPREVACFTNSSGSPML